MTEMEIVAKNMRSLRTKLDMSQAKLAEKVGVSEQTIYLYERAERSMPLDKLGKVAFSLGLSRAMDLLNENLEARLNKTEGPGLRQRWRPCLPTFAANAPLPDSMLERY